MTDASTFLSAESWGRAFWIATTFRWHPGGAAPPIMGLVFADAEAGRALFREWAAACDHRDELEELRVAVVEGDIPGMEPGYSVHLCPDPEALMIRAAAEGREAGGAAPPSRVSRMHPHLGGDPSMLPAFKREYERHGQYLLAPVTRRGDGQLYVDVDCGVEKTVLHFRDAADIGPGDIDASVLRPPIFELLANIRPPE